MSDIPQGIATYPGVERLSAATFSYTHGISPSVAQLTIAPQTASPSEHGTLRFTFGGVAVEFPDCKVDHGTIERGVGGEIGSLSILDRRWRWRFGTISGTYNVRRDDASLQQGENGSIDTQRSPQQLAALCLQAMGESNFDVADLPNDTRPSVEWDGVVPAEALATLCDQLGCRVVLQFDNRVALRRVGMGAELPTGDRMQFSPTINPPERPDTIAVVGGPTRYQVDFPLEAVGLVDADAPEGDRFRPIDLLDYAPSGGWAFSDPPYFHQVNAPWRALAQKSVFKYYRIKTPVAVPGYEGPNGNLVERLEQILPIEDEQVKLVGENGQLANQAAVVFGVWHEGGFELTNTCSTLEPLEAQEDFGAKSLYRRPFVIDLARGLVIFDEPVYRNGHVSATGGNGYEVVLDPAQLVLRATCSVRDSQSQALARYERRRATGANAGTEPRYIRHEELLLATRPDYAGSYSIEGIDDNRDPLDSLADEILDAAELDYVTSNPRTAQYAGLRIVEVDGAIQQISLHVGVSGATTTISRSNELPRLGRAHHSMRRLQRQRAAEAAADRPSPRALAQALKTNPRTKPRSGS